MALASGTTLGPYRIADQLGAGGMGEVYRATDTRLDRTVAIKVLPEHLAADPQRRERFEREARAVSSLNHPYICTLHDIGHQDGIDFLVMELVEGETLESRLTRGPLPLGAALDHAIQIADALDKAHRQGVVHRDLKPGNVMLTKAGVKLLDFGLAKLTGDASPTAQWSEAPTRQKSLTEEGTILGTLQYMSPEQLEGAPTDARTDIFSFGALVYEMVTGKRAFEGKSQASLISSIMSSEPTSMASLQSTTPVSLDRVVRQCLAKTPDDRWQSAGDLMRELRWISRDMSEGRTHAPGTPTSFAAGRRRIALAAIVAAVVGGLLVGAALWWAWPDVTPAPQVERWEVTLEPDVSVAADRAHTQVPQLALSPDGSTLVVSVERGGTTLLKSRRLDSYDWSDLPGTSGGRQPFFSPDGEWVGFFTDEELKKVPLRGGGAPVRLGRASVVTGATWGPDGTIVYADDGGARLMRVSADDRGEPTVVQERQGGEWFRGPVFLPDGRTLLVAALQQTFSTRIDLIRIDTGERRTVVPRGGGPHYLSNGYLVYAGDDGMLAALFDTASGQAGSPKPVLESIVRAWHSSPQVAISTDGTVAYLPGKDRRVTTPVWYDRQIGSFVPTGLPAGRWRNPRISPDGEHFVIALEEASTKLRVYRVADGRFLRNLTDEMNGAFPVWFDNRCVVFMSDRRVVDSSTPGGMFMKCLDDVDARPVLPRGAAGLLAVPYSGSAKSGLVAFELLTADRAGDIWVTSIDESAQAKPFLQSTNDEAGPVFSPNGRYIAYASSSSGTWELYVEQYPSSDRRWRLTSAGGSIGMWSGAGDELFFADDDGVSVMPVDTRAPGFSWKQPVRLFVRPVAATGGLGFDVTPNGQRVLFLLEPEDAPPTHIRVVTNWLTELASLFRAPD